MPDLLWIVKQDRDTWTKDDRDIAKVWDTEVGNRYRNTSMADLRHVIEEFPDLEPELILNTILYDLDGWHKVCGEVLNEMASENYTVLDTAVPPASSAATSVLKRLARLKKTWKRLLARFINLEFGEALIDQLVYDPRGEIPTINRIFEGIHVGKENENLFHLLLTTGRSSESSLCEMEVVLWNRPV